MQIIEILYIEDSMEDAMLLKKSLENFTHGHNISFNINHVKTIKDACEALKASKFHAILLDLNLPDGSGIETVKAIRENNPNLPMIVITGDSGEEMGLEALREGAQEYLLKENISGAILSQIIQSSIFRKRFENELYHKAYYDFLTDLPNKQFFENVVSTILNRSRRWKKKEAILFVDLDRFKMVNDTYGHEAGDHILRESAARMKQSLRTSDVLARFAGDEFVIYLDSNDDNPLNIDDCKMIAEKIVQNVNKPYLFHGETIYIGCSIGIAIFPDHGEDYDTLLRNADMAMYEAKQNAQASIWMLAPHTSSQQTYG